MFYYRIGEQLCCSPTEDLPYEKAEQPKDVCPLVWLFDREAGSCRASFKVNSPDLLFQDKEDVSWLSSHKLSGAAAGQEADPYLLSVIRAGLLRAVNLRHPKFQEIVGGRPLKEKKRVHVLAIGDVGSTLLTGLHLLGGDCISSIGICDISEKVTARWEFEENQIAYPWAYDALPEVDIVAPENLFQCDVFVFVASKGIPPVGSQVKDVRMYQFENNSKIVALYARQARRDGFKGLFAVVSDPVDPLAKTAWLESNKDENGVLDYQGLRPEQVQGFGLGVMNARAAYYAKRDERFKQFLTEGRSFGPHGEDLVVADSIERYNDELSKELTHLTVTANLHMRAIGFKPFIAPAYSSGAISLILTLRGEWHCGSVFLGGIFMGVKNRYTPYGLETEILPLPEALYERIVTAQEHLKTIVYAACTWEMRMEEAVTQSIMTEQTAARTPGRRLTVIAPREEAAAPGSRFEEVLGSALDGREWRRVEKEEELRAFLRERSKRGADEQEEEPLLFALSLGKTGINLEYIRMLRFLREHTNALEGCVGGALVDGRSDLYTKSVARELVFTANRAGCAFVGRPLVEGTKTLSNFSIVARNMDTDLLSAYKKSAAILTDEILEFKRPVSERPSLLVLHASSHPNSNTFALWGELKGFLTDFQITEIGLRNGTVSDCSGCPYKMCLHFGENESCFYGGVMVEDVYPAVKKADAILMLCPNYNDALSANLTAFINRLTALFRIIRFYDKALFAVVVSGYSGSDIVAEQLIAALNMNKTFYLPPRFALMETANAPGAAMKLPGIHERLRAFAAHMRRTLKVPERSRKETDRSARKIL